MRSLVAIAVFTVALLPAPLLVQSDFWLTWLTLALFYAYLGQAWNLLGGYGGQFSFGHALFLELVHIARLLFRFILASTLGQALHCLL